MIRVFLSAWELRYEVPGDDASRYIWHPIPDAVDALPVLTADVPRDQRVRWFAEYPDANADGQPDGQAVLVFVAAPEVPPEISDLPGVTMLPPLDLSTQVSLIAPATVSAVIDSLAAYGVPFPAIEGSATAGELLDRIVGYSQVNPISVTARFAGREAEFA